MTKDLADELERLATKLDDEPDAARRIYRTAALSLWVENNLPQILSALRANPAEGEPVAWRRRGKDLRWEYRDDGSTSVAFVDWHALYTRPVAWPDRKAVARKVEDLILAALYDHPHKPVPAGMQSTVSVIADDIAALLSGGDDLWLQAAAEIISLRADITGLEDGNMTWMCDQLDKAKAENAAQAVELERMREALEMIAEGSAPPDPHGHYLAHRRAVDVARQALSVKAG